MLPKRICVECGEIHALLKCPKCGCRQHEPITDAMTLALLAKNDRIAELEAALDISTKWIENIVNNGGASNKVVAAMPDENVGLKQLRKALDGNK